MLQILVILFCFFSSHVYAIELSKELSIKILIEKSLELVDSRFDIEFHKAHELTVGLWANPSLLIDSQLSPFGHNWNQETSGGPTQRDFILSVPIDINGKRSKATDVAKLATRVSEAYFQGVIREKILELLTSLHSLKRIRSELQVLAEKKNLLEKSVATLEKRFGSGNIQPLVQNRAKLALDESALLLREKALDEKKEENKIRSILQFDHTEKIILKDLDEKSVEKNFEFLKKQAIQERPDFRAMFILKKQRSFETELEKKKIWDDLILQGGVTRQERMAAMPRAVTNPSLDGAWSWMVGVTIPIPIFDRKQGSLMTSKIQENQVEVKINIMKQDLERDLINSLSSLENQELSLKLFRKDQLINAKRVRDSALRQFGTGASTLIEYLDAVDAYHSTISTYLRTKYEWDIEKVNLRYIAGMPL